MLNLRPVLAGYFYKQPLTSIKILKWSRSQFSFISAGMDYAPADKISLMYENVFYDTKELRTDLKEIAKHLNSKKTLWNNAVKKVPSLYDYLKDT